MAETKHYNVVVIGSGFGGTMTGLALAREFARRKKGETILMLERGTWWTTPVGTVQDKEVKTASFLRDKGQPVQYWSSIDHFKGLLDLVTRCVRRPKNEDGLYDLTNFGSTRIGGKTDGVMIARANGVGGGSLIYANVTIQPPDFIFEHQDWRSVNWDLDSRNRYFQLARDAIGYGVVYALNNRKPDSPDGKPNAVMETGTDDEKKGLAKLKINTGLSNIATRSARLEPGWREKVDPATGRVIRQLDPDKLLVASDPTKPDSPKKLNPRYALWIDRARVFQAAMSKIADDYGVVDSSINDITPEPNPLADVGKNYCERQGRCIIGCLPGARHTLNKQLMRAILGTPQGDSATFPDMHLDALAEVDVLEARPEGGYRVHYLSRNPKKPWKTTTHKVTADRVIVAAGCVGTNEIMLRSKARGTLPNLSHKVGYGFSTNGDYLAFLDDTKERVNLARGPVTTSFAHFNTKDASKFHTIEDNGIPRVFSSLTGVGIPLARAVTGGRVKRTRRFIIWAIVKWFFKRFLPDFVGAIFKNANERQKLFESEDEYTANMMCIAAMGRDQAIGQFRLGNQGETTLRVARTDGKPFYKDPIYDEIRKSLEHFAKELKDDNGKRGFINPFLKLGKGGLGAPIALSHPLGGCRMAADDSLGVVDEYGHVFDTSKSGQQKPFHKGLYIADASVISTALGVNPSLTISALALRIADKIIEEINEQDPV